MELANPLQGTDSSWPFSHGNTYPAIALPFPMNTWAPYTQPQSESFYYQYRHHEIRGIRETHQPSAWIPEYGSLRPHARQRQAAFSLKMTAFPLFEHSNEIAQPSYYQVKLDKWNASVELTPTERGARFRLNFCKPGDSYVILDLFKSEKPSSLEIIPAEHKIIGVTRNNQGAVPDNFGNYIVIVFDQPFTASGTWSNETATADSIQVEGHHVQAFVKFNASQTATVGCRIASSFISPNRRSAIWIRRLAMPISTRFVNGPKPVGTPC